MGAQERKRHQDAFVREKDSERIRGFGHHRLSTFGIGADLDVATWRSVFRQLVARGLMRVDVEGFGSLKLTGESRAVLRGACEVRLGRAALRHLPRRDPRSDGRAAAAHPRRVRRASRRRGEEARTLCGDVHRGDRRPRLSAAGARARRPCRPVRLPADPVSQARATLRATDRRGRGYARHSDRKRGNAPNRLL